MMQAWHMLKAGTISPHSTQLLQTPLVCQQVVQPMESVPDYPRMQCVDSGTQHCLVDKTTKVDTKLGKACNCLKIPSVISTSYRWRDTLSCH